MQASGGVLGGGGGAAVVPGMKTAGTQEPSLLPQSHSCTDHDCQPMMAHSDRMSSVTSYVIDSVAHCPVCFYLDCPSLVEASANSHTNLASIGQRVCSLVEFGLVPVSLLLPIWGIKYTGIGFSATSLNTRGFAPHHERGKKPVSTLPSPLRQIGWPSDGD